MTETITTRDQAFAHEIAALRTAEVWELAESHMADCGSPDRTDSPGAVFLDGVRRDTLDLIERVGVDVDPDTIDDDGELHTIADEAPDYRTPQRWAEFVDLQAYEEDVTDLGEVDGNDLTRSVAGVALFMIADRLARAIVNQVRDAVLEADEDEAEGGSA